VDRPGDWVYWKRCAEALEVALADTPFYAPWRAADPGRGVSVARRYAAMPALTKADIRAHFPRGFVPAGVDFEAELESGRVSYVSTSGSTADQVTLFWSQAWWDESERASWSLNDHLRRAATGAHREAVLASPRCVGPCRIGERLPVQERTLGRLLFLNQTLSPASWCEREAHRMLDELDAYRPAVLEADPFYLAALAAFALDHSRPVFQPEVITLTYSFPARVFLNVIRRAFRAPLVSSHGSTEAGYVFLECECGRMHQNTASCHVDFAPQGRSPSGAALGGLLVTPFGHPVQRLVRFDVGDLAERVEGVACPCGRSDGLTLERIVGRAADVTLARGGRSVTVAEVDAAVAAVPGVRGFQVDQSADGALRARVCLAPEAGEVHGQVCRALADVYACPVPTDVVSALEHEQSGKVRLARRAAV
jgi:phenylacetate-coenzyme A ligase PaaK-like adenylate-forming protein